VALQVENLHAPSGVRDVSLEVRVGEIVGLSGLVGSGRTEVARAIFGADPITSGKITIFGQHQNGGPLRAIKLGTALIPESRKSQGLALMLSCAHNITMASLKKLFPSGWFTPSKNLAQSNALIKRLRVATPGAHQLVQFLSGGNQQKVVISKWLSAESRLFIFDEPTRGIDVGAKAEIFSLIDGLVKQGAAVLMISSELSEIVKVCDRAYVMRDGRVAGELKREGITEESILALGVHDALA
jgi:ribose transport system ATP-binding protein